VPPMTERELIAWLSSGTVTVQRIGSPRGLAEALRLRHGLEVYRERPDGPPYLVSFVNVQGFRAEMRLALQGGRLAVSELHVTPERGELPRGGITSRILRYIPVHAHVQKVRREDLEAVVLGTELAGMLRAFDAPASPPPATRPGRRPVAPETLLDVADAYARAVKDRSAQPTRDAAKALGMEMGRVRDYVHRARTRGLLTPTAPGRLGGTLTPRARAMLRERTRKTTRRRRSR
jgi:hypothetical protein